jgi:hypothetical protein
MLTAKRVEQAKRGRYHDGHGLYLQVVNANNKSWLLRYERYGRERWYGIGPAHTFSLKEARERARAARQLLYDGLDPIDHRRAERAKMAAARARALTFREAAENYHSQHESAWRNRKHAAQFLSTLRAYAFPVLGNMSSPGLVKDEHRSIRNNARLAGAFLESDRPTEYLDRVRRTRASSKLAELGANPAAGCNTVWIVVCCPGHQTRSLLG